MLFLLIFSINLSAALKFSQPLTPTYLWFGFYHIVGPKHFLYVWAPKGIFLGVQTGVGCTIVVYSWEIVATVH